MDYSKTALVLIDLQKGILELPVEPHSTETIVNNANRLIQRFREKGGFIVFAHVAFLDGKDKLTPNSSMKMPDKDDSTFSQFADELYVQDNDLIITKRHFSAFFGSELDLQLRRRGITSVVIGGISTHVGVDTTARDAYQYGYDQYFIEDAMSAPRKAFHDFSVNNIFPMLGQVMTTDEFLEQY